MANNKPITPTDMLGDGIEGGEFQGTYVRKGSIAAFVANVKALPDAEGSDREAILAQLRELRPALEAVGLFDVFSLRDETLLELLKV